MIDFSTDFGKRVARRLEEEWIMWLTTVDSKHMPQPRPVWYLWDGETFLVYSAPDTYKLRHIARNPYVALHMDGDGLGGDIVVFVGEAHIVENAPPPNEVEAYVTKYRDGMARIGMTVDQYAQAYPVGIRITPTALRGL